MATVKECLDTIGDAVKNQIHPYMEEREKLKHEIMERRSEIRVPEICDKAWDLYSKKLRELRQDNVLGYNAMKAELLEYYLIICHSYEIIPKY